MDGQTKGQIVNNSDHEQIITVMLKLFYMELENETDVAGGMGLNNSTERAPGESGGDGKANIDERGQHETSPSKLSVFKEVKPEKPISIMNVKPEKSLAKTKTTLEFVIVSLCQALQINPNQAAGLLTDHNYYLMHACVKGIKGDYVPILKWYQLLYDTCKHLIDLAVESLPVPDPEDEKRSLNDSQILEEDTQALFVLLSALKCGFFSDYFEVSGQAFKLFSKISNDLNSYGYQKVFAKWYLQKPDADNGKLGGGLEATLYMLNKHSQIAESVALLLISSFKGSFNLLIPEIQQNHIQDNMAQLYILINDLLPFLHKHHREEVVQKLLVESDLILALLDQSMTNKFSDNAIKSACLSLIAEIWTLEPNLISDNPTSYRDGSSVLDTCLKVFKNTCKFSSRSMKISTIGLMFKLLDQFARSRDNQAPVIYKLLTFALIENIHDDDIREFMLRSFTNVFTQHKTIPVSILVEPMLRIMQLQEQRYVPNVLDFTFFKTLANHPKLTQPNLALQIMDQFAKMTLNDPLWSSSAKLPLLILAERFKDEAIIQEFLLKFCQLALTSAVQLKKQVNPPSSANKGNNQMGLTGNPRLPPGITQLRLKQTNMSGMLTQIVEPKHSPEFDIARRIKLATIVHVVESILQMRAPLASNNDTLYKPLNEHLLPVALEANRRYFQTHHDYSKALLQVLEFWHQFDAMKALDEYIKEKAEEERPPEEEIVTIVRDQPSHIHEDSRGRVLLNEINSSFREENGVTSRNGDRNNQRIFEQEDYFRLLPSENTNQSEISSQAVRNINNSQLNSRQNNNGNNLYPPRDLSQDGSRMIVPYSSNNQIVTVTQGSYAKPPSVAPSRRLNIMAQKHIDAIKNKREEKVIKQQLEEEKKRINKEKSVMRAKEVVDRRRVQLGIIKGSNEQQLNEGQLMLFEGPPEDVEPGRVSPKRHSMPGTASTVEKGDNGIRLIDLDNEEEERDRDGVKIALNRYSKVFKFLFNKFAMSRAQHMKVENFEYFGDKSINLAEICKLLREHDLLALSTHNSILNHVSTTSRENISTLSKITKEQIQTLMRLLNLKNFKRQDISALSFNHFMELIPQLAYLACSKTYSHLSLPDMIIKLLLHFEKATKAKNQSTILYEDPDTTTIGDMEMLKEMNRRVKDNPDYILPEGYYKVAEKEQNFNYTLPAYMNIPEPKRIAVETLDWLMNQALGIHFLEAVVTYENRFKVKPRIKHAGAFGSKSSESGQQSNPGLAFMKPIEKKPFNRDLSGLKLPNTGSNPDLKKVNQTPAATNNLGPLQVHPAIENKAAQSKQLKDVSGTRPKLSAPIKLEILQVTKLNPRVDPLHLQETAEVLEELLQAVEQGHKGPHLPDRKAIAVAKEEIKNKVQEDKEAKLNEERAIQKQKEDIRKKRHEKLKEDIEKQKQDKLKQEEEQKAQNSEKEKEEERQKRIERTMLRNKVESKRIQHEEAKAKKQEEKEAKIKAEEEKIAQERKERAKGQKDFFKKQKEQLGQEFVKRREEIEQAEKVQKEMELLKKQQADKVKEKMVGYLKGNKEQLRNETAEWNDIAQFYSQQEVQQVFQKYEKSFGQMFKHWAAMDKKDMAVHSMMRININEFQKFGFQNKIVPKIVTSEDLVLIFRALVRERTSTMTQKEQDEIGLGVNSLGLEDFKKALIRVAILGQANLQEGEHLENILPHIMSQPDIPKQTGTSVRVPKNVRVRGRSQINSRASQRQPIKDERNISRADSQTALEKPEQNPTGEEQVPIEQNTTPISNSTKPIGLVRKTKEQKILEELAKVKEREEKLMKVKIDDKKFNKNFDVSIINPHTVEAILQFLNVVPNDEKRNAKLGLDPSFINSSKNQGNKQQAPHIEAIDLDELENQGYDEDQLERVVAPDGKHEDWKMEEEDADYNNLDHQ